jgi:hypothetical protein
MLRDARVVPSLCPSLKMALSNETPLEILILGGGVAG